ncbi:MAG: hypothetical protein ACFFED_13875 [Candidatus Thorarchaeota archaeon]
MQSDILIGPFFFSAIIGYLLLIVLFVIIRPRENEVYSDFRLVCWLFIVSISLVLGAAIGLFVEFMRSLHIFHLSDPLLLIIIITSFIPPILMLLYIPWKTRNS